ncbi:hypothetical protein BJV74DRAFT_881687 [Russula compacta]|nr:hypothetical protein BJV74DRAFT_881687 [Russula compacta]
MPARPFAAIALASILSGIFLVSICVLLVQFLLLRRKAPKPALLRGVADDHDQLEQQQQALGASSAKEKEKKQGRSLPPPQPLRASLNLEPNQPIFVDVTVTVDSESESGSQLSHAELLQLILTPPTPAKAR